MELNQIQEQLEKEFQQVRAAARTTSINILSLRMALVDKEVCTEEELEAYDNQAKELIDDLLSHELDKMQQAIREQFGDEAADQMMKDFQEAFSSPQQ